MKKLKLLLLAILTTQMSFGFFGFGLGPIGVFGGRRWGGPYYGRGWGGRYYGWGRPYYSPFYW